MQEKIIKGEAPKEEIIKIFELFDEKGMTDEELAGIVDVTRENMNRVEIDFDCLDTCGTGGDKLNTFNISTVSAIVCAAAGVPVAKHGNRAASSKCGSADVLEKLGVKIELDSKQAKRCLEDTGIVFMFAPLFHPALKFVKDARTEYGKKTYFNILGPMLNPAMAKYQVIGVADITKANLIGKTLLQTGSERAMIVQGDEGLDEISIEKDTQIIDFNKKRNEAENYKINPLQLGLDIYPLAEIKGGESEENARIFLNILKNEATLPQLNAVLLNAAAGLLAFGKVKDFSEGVELAYEIIKSGKALKKLEEFIEVSNKL